MYFPLFIYKAMGFINKLKFNKNTSIQENGLDFRVYSIEASCDGMILTKHLIDDW